MNYLFLSWQITLLSLPALPALALCSRSLLSLSTICSRSALCSLLSLCYLLCYLLSAICSLLSLCSLLGLRLPPATKRSQSFLFVIMSFHNVTKSHSVILDFMFYDLLYFGIWLLESILEYVRCMIRTNIYINLSLSYPKRF